MGSPLLGTPHQDILVVPLLSFPCFGFSICETGVSIGSSFFTTPGTQVGPDILPALPPLSLSTMLWATPQWSWEYKTSFSFQGPHSQDFVPLSSGSWFQGGILPRVGWGITVWLRTGHVTEAEPLRAQPDFWVTFGFPSN